MSICVPPRPTLHAQHAKIRIKEDGWTGTAIQQPKGNGWPLLRFVGPAIAAVTTGVVADAVTIAAGGSVCGGDM